MCIFPPNNILEEEIFTPRNLGPDCDIIGGLLERFGEEFILSALEDGEYAIAVEHYLQLLDSLTTHFIADEHWCWFDDFYSQDYTVSHIWDAFIPHLRSGVLAGESLAELESGIKQIEQTEAYQNYGIPSMIPFSDLKNVKTIWSGSEITVPLFGNNLPTCWGADGRQVGMSWGCPRRFSRFSHLFLRTVSAKSAMAL